MNIKTKTYDIFIPVCLRIFFESLDICIKYCFSILQYWVSVHKLIINGHETQGKNCIIFIGSVVSHQVLLHNELLNYIVINVGNRFPEFSKKGWFGIRHSRYICSEINKWRITPDRYQCILLNTNLNQTPSLKSVNQFKETGSSYTSISLS